MREVSTKKAPQPSGAYSQALEIDFDEIGGLVFLAGQIGIDPETQVLEEGVQEQAVQIFANLKAVAKAAGGTLDDITKLTVYLTDFNYFTVVNELMARTFHAPYPARTTVEVSALPRGAKIEIDAIMVKSS